MKKHYQITLFLLALISACASQTLIPRDQRVAISARHTGRTVELRQSCYYGNLYDENEKLLLTPYPFGDTFHLVDPKGKPIHPTGERGIVKAGTKFIIKDVEFPDPAALATRMLTTPRYNPWIYLSPADHATLQGENKDFVLLLPMDLNEEKLIESAINELLAPAGEVTTWLSQRAPTIAVGIEHKEIVVGMNIQELVAAKGQPLRRFKDTHSTGAADVAWYNKQEAWLVDNIVVDQKPGREVK